MASLRTTRALDEHGSLHRVGLLRLALAIVIFVAPVGLAPFARRDAAATRWELLEAWPGYGVVERVSGAAASASILYAIGAIGGPYISADAGETWRQAEIPLARGRLEPTRVIDMAVNPMDPSEAYVVLESPEARPRPMLHVTTDAGLNWAALGGLGPRRVRAIAFGPTSSDLYLVTLGDVFRAKIPDQGGHRLVRSDEEMERGHVVSIDASLDLTQFAIGHPPDTQAALGRRSLYLGTRHNGLAVFVDDMEQGTTWVPAADNAVSGHIRERADIRAIGVHPVRPGTVCVGTDAGLYASTDGGQSWFATAYALRSEIVLSILFDAPEDRTYVGLAGGGVLYSDDGLETWRRLGPGLGRISVHSLAIVEADDRTLLVGTNDGLWSYRLSGI